MLPLDIEEIAQLNLWEPWFKTAPTNQTTHRVRLAQSWDITEGSRVLELGCGQGDCTAVLAAAVGESGHVTGVDPASLDYGSPSTLGQAQAHLRQSKIGSRMTFVQSDPTAFISNSENASKFDTAVLAHCIYYMASPSTLFDILRALHDKAPSIKKLCIAEYALTASVPEAYPHVLAVLMEAALEVHKDGETSDSNVRTVIGPVDITKLANQAGWTVRHEGVLIPDAGLEDGRWEVSAAMGISEKDIAKLISGERERALVGAMKESVVKSISNMGDKSKVRTMDVWWSIFTRAD
ncbi:methyltransferase domain protein [Ceratobasidium sp. AG-Ba]|nr:methyltransferase domain protein [Ceratobasidium sp. AG-Ba]